MTTTSLILIVLIGAIAGWLAGMLMKGRGLGILGNIVVGVVGAFIGTWLLGALGITLGGGFIAAVVNALITHQACACPSACKTFPNITCGIGALKCRIDDVKGGFHRVFSIRVRDVLVLVPSASAVLV